MVLSRKASAIAPSMTLKIDALSKEMKANGLDVVGFGLTDAVFSFFHFRRRQGGEWNQVISYVV
ncbi:MAG: hypothetical protein IJ973_05795 [Christensenellaceae bacterium]|nr:hypothetical protein [Christensenellaceae bacterium]